MALNNFEKQVQQKLKNREIKPSVTSWDRLDAMLSVTEKPKKNKNIFWIQLAASLLFFMSMGYYFYNQNTNAAPVKQESIIVGRNSEFKIQNSEKKEDNKKQTETIKEVLVENNILTKENTTSSMSKQQFVAISEAHNPQQVSMINPSQEISKSSNAEMNKQQATINYRYISPKQLLAQIENTNTPNQSVVTKSNAKIKVDANVLLSNAENELNQTFRANVIKKLNKNYQELATAIANRNYEE